MADYRLDLDFPAAKGLAITEAEWFTSKDPAPMLQFLRGKASDRKLRLFACACCRRIWQLLADERSRKAVEVAECFADGLIGAEEIQAADLIALDAARDAEKRERDWWVAITAAGAATNWGAIAAEWASTPPRDRPPGVRERGNPIDYVAPVASRVARVVGMAAGETAFAAKDYRNVKAAEETGASAARNELATMLRCIIRNPFHPIAMDPVWRTPKVVAFAQAIYNNRTFDRLPELADALTVIGCTDADILRHCCEGGAHVRGCWVLDALLEKE
jgi:hypothetical protein